MWQKFIRNIQVYIRRGSSTSSAGRDAETGIIVRRSHRCESDWFGAAVRVLKESHLQRIPARASSAYICRENLKQDLRSCCRKGEAWTIDEMESQCTGHKPALIGFNDDRRHCLLSILPIAVPFDNGPLPISVSWSRLFKFKYAGEALIESR